MQYIEATISNGPAARIYRGAEARAESLVLHLHGGAFVAGVPEGGCAVAALLAEAGAVVVSLDYPLAPAHPFPQALEAAYAALAWAAQRRHGLAMPGTRLYVAGEEAGGNLAAALAMMARDRAGPSLAGAVLLSPMLDCCVATASLRRVHAGPVGCPWADGWRQYLARACDATHPYATPGLSLRLAGLPDTLLLTSIDDPMCDETRAYARRLREAGVSVDEVVLPFATGWPASYRQAMHTQAPWSGAVRAHVRRFLAHPTRRTPS